MVKECTIIELTAVLCQSELCCSNMLKTVTVMVRASLLRCMHPVTSAGVQMFNLSNILLTALPSIESVLSSHPAYKISLGLRTSEKEMEGFPK